MYYDRSVPEEFLELFEPGSVLSPVLQFAIDNRPLTDFQLRAYRNKPTQPEFRATVYCGLTALINVTAGKRNRPKMSVHKTWAESGDFDPLWRKSRAPAEWAQLAPSLRSYLERAYAAACARKRYTTREGQVQSALCAQGCDEFSVVDREAVVGYTDSAEREAFVTELKATYQEAVRPSLNEERWWKTPPPFGNELDLVAVDEHGSVLVIEVKPASETKGLAWAPAQVGYYTHVFEAWAAEIGEDGAIESIERMLAQRVRLGLSTHMAVSRPLKFVPVVAVGEGTRSKVVWGRQRKVRGALANRKLFGSDAQLWEVTKEGRVEDVTEKVT